MSDSESGGDLNKDVWSWKPPPDPRARALLLTESGAPINFFVFDDVVSKQRLENIILTYGGSVCCEDVETYTIILVNKNFKPPNSWGPCYSRNFIKDCIESFDILELEHYLISGCAPSCEGGSLSAALYYEEFNFRPEPVPVSFYTGASKPIKYTRNPDKMFSVQDDDPCYGVNHQKTDKPEKLNLIYKDKAPKIIYGRFCQCRKQFYVTESNLDTNSRVPNTTDLFTDCIGEPQQIGGSKGTHLYQATSDKTENNQNVNSLPSLPSSPDCLSDNERESSANIERIKQNIFRSGRVDSSNQGLVCKDKISESIVKTDCQDKILNSNTSNNVNESTSDVAEEIHPIVNSSCISHVHEETDNIAEVQPSNISSPNNNAQDNNQKAKAIGEHSTPKKNSLSTFSPSSKISPIDPRVSSTTSSSSVSERYPKHPTLLKTSESAAANNCEVNKLKLVKNASDGISDHNLLAERRLNDEVAGPSNAETYDDCSLLAPFQGIKRGKPKRTLTNPLGLINATQEDDNTTRLSADKTVRESNVASPIVFSESSSDDDFPNLRSWPGNRKKLRENKHTKTKYTRKEKTAIIKFIIAKKAYGRLRSDALYREIEERNICPKRTYQSMKNHLIKTILNELDTFEFLTDNMKRKFRGEIW